LEKRLDFAALLLLAADLKVCFHFHVPPPLLLILTYPLEFYALRVEVIGASGAFENNIECVVLINSDARPFDVAPVFSNFTSAPTISSAITLFAYKRRRRNNIVPKQLQMFAKRKEKTFSSRHSGSAKHRQSFIQLTQLNATNFNVAVTRSHAIFRVLTRKVLTRVLRQPDLLVS
jgi:hypothetical protein